MRHIKNDSEEYYIDDNGKLHGEYKGWYDNGQLHVHRHYVDSEFHGEYKRWHTNGQLLKHCHLVYGKLHGEYKEWHYDGQLRVHSHYVHGQRHGEFRTWNSFGTSIIHTYEFNDEEVHDLMKNPLSDEEKFELQLMHGGRWLQ